ncbi:MAG: SH3 domain-containing protein [Thermoplasmata archaeon]
MTRSLSRSTRASDPPLKVRRGEPVTVGERSDEWPAFVLVTTPTGGCGWVPERRLGRERPRTRVRREYDTTSLEPAVGETLFVLAADPESGWLWCYDVDRRVGWYPEDYVDAL